MNNSIYPCITLKGKIAEAVPFYIDTFGEEKVTQKAPHVIMIELSGQKIMFLNDGPNALPNGAISFMVSSETAEETELYWSKLIDGGKALMPIDSYPWSIRYGWIQDKYGVSWQFITGDQKASQKFSPSFMFTGDNAGKAAAAVDFYTQLFPNSHIEGIMKYTEGDGDTSGLVKHAQFKINDFTAMAMDSSANHGFNFNDAISLVVNCDTQTEIDTYWNQLTADGGKEVACGWLTDKYGISWQIVPKILGKLMSDPNRGQRVMNALMKMKKLVIADLESA